MRMNPSPTFRTTHARTLDLDTPDPETTNTSIAFKVTISIRQFLALCSTAPLKTAEADRYHKHPRRRRGAVYIVQHLISKKTRAMGMPSKPCLSYSHIYSLSDLSSKSPNNGTFPHVNVPVVWTSDDERMATRTVPATDSSPEPPPRPVVRRRRRVPRRTQTVRERILIQNEPVDTAGQNNIQILRVGPRLREVSIPTVDQARASENQAATNEQRRVPVEAAASDNVLAWSASPGQAETQVSPPTAASGSTGRSMRNTRRLFISDGWGSGRSYYNTVNGTRTSPAENETYRPQEHLQRESSPSTTPPSPAGLTEPLASRDQLLIDLIRVMDAE